MTNTPPRSEPRIATCPHCGEQLSVAEAAHPTAASTDALRAAAGRILAITVQETLPEALRQELQDLAIKIRALASSPPPGQTTAEAVGPTLQEGKRATSAPPPTEGLDV
jgi:hypothetical protein